MPIGDRVTVSGARYPDPVTIGSYSVERRLAAGRYTLVYAVAAPDGRRLCAKLLMPPFDESEPIVAAFLQNAQATVGLQHPHVVEVMEVGREHGRPFVVTELVEGTDLARVISRDGALRPRIALEYVRQAALGLEAAHARGLRHGDVRPRHMLLAATGSMKLAGFGLSPRWTTAHGREIAGDAAYLSPECVHGQRLDQRSDIYSLGCSLFELLTTRTPFGVGAPDALLACHVHEPFPRPSQQVPGIPADLDELLRKMAAKNPNGRPAGYRELLRLIQGVMPSLGAEPSSGPVLVVEVGREPGLTVEVPEGDTLIGRCEDEGFFLDDARVSRRHALLRRQGDAVYVEDLGSKNGIRVNGAPTEHARLFPGDRLAIGDSILVLVADEVSEPVPEAANRAPGASPVRGAFGDDEVAHAPGKQMRATSLESVGLEAMPVLVKGLGAAARVLAQTRTVDEAARRLTGVMQSVVQADAGLWVDVQDGHAQLAATSASDAERLSCVLPAVERALPGHLSLSTSVRAGRAGLWGVALAPVRVREEAVCGFVVLVSYSGRFPPVTLALLEASCSLLSERATVEAATQVD